MELLGVGKTFFKDKIVSKLGFNKVNTIRTRKMRVGEENGKSGIFVTDDELIDLKSKGEIIYDFKVFGGTYAYKKEEILSSKNMVFEMHYTTIYDWKKIKPDIKTIYILPTDIEIPKQKAMQRNLSKDKELERINEIQIQYNNFLNDKKLQNMFDYIVYNNYDKKSETEIINLVQKLINTNQNGDLHEKCIF